MTFTPLPRAPSGVRYALTVPQSVLFADLSLRGSLKLAFHKAFGVDFDIGWVAIDDGAMSWDFRGTPDFASQLLGTTDVRSALRRFISAMQATARAVDVTSELLGPSAIRRRENPRDLIADLCEYWDAYELHMTSLFTFWNVEQFMSDALITELKAHGLDSEVEAGLQRFLQPSETNYFALERRHLALIGSRFNVAAAEAESSPDLQAAIAQHIDAFGFLLAPFNLGAPPSVNSVLDRLLASEATGSNASAQPMLELRPDHLNDLPEPLRELALMAQELTFWKTERLDIFALADSRVAGMYRAAAAALDIGTDVLFAMRRDEIEASLTGNRVAVDAETLQDRLTGYCLLLNDQSIAFYAPTRGRGEAPRDRSHQAETTADTLRGIGAARGRVEGTVRIIKDIGDIERLEQGDVLVTPMTRPEMGAALDRAAAFVTDEGGLLSHAAIISREMGKPCVIGTEVATERLRDGLRVEVDGDRGIVTILEVHG